MKISLNQQIEELERELRTRASVYPRLVGGGKLRQAVADYQVERLRAAKSTLEWLAENETAIRAALAARDEYSPEEIAALAEGSKE